MRLGSAEQTALQATQELSSLRGETKALMEEIESISASFDEVQDQNSRLMKTVALKEEAATKLMAERHRSEERAKLLEAEKATYVEKATAAAQLAQRQSDLSGSLEHNLKLSQEALAKKEVEARAAMELLDRHKREVQEVKQESQSATMTLKASEDAVNRSREREAKSAAASIEEAAKAKRAMQECQALQRQLARITPSAGGSNADSAGDSSGLTKEEADYYRSRVNCPLCKTKEKDAIINKCGHAFCRDCINQRLNLRNRKCPACSQQFDYQAVRDLFLIS